MFRHRSIHGYVSIIAGGLLCLGAATGAAINANSTSDETVDSDGQKVSFASNDRIGVTADGKKYAPRPDVEFHDEQCTSRDHHSAALGADIVEISASDITAPLTTTSDLDLPPAPAAAWYSASAPIGSPEGTSIVAGHVDYTEKDSLSPFGHLHQVQPCDTVSLAGEDGVSHQYQITSKYTVERQELESTGIFTGGGPAKLALVTCSGPSVADVGEDFRFHYAYNLVIEAEPVGEAA